MLPCGGSSCTGEYGSVAALIGTAAGNPVTIPILAVLSLDLGRAILGDGLSLPFGEDVEQAQLHAGHQHLRVDEAGHQIEQAACSAPGDRPGERESGCETVESGAAEQLIADVHNVLCDFFFETHAFNLIVIYDILSISTA